MTDKARPAPDSLVNLLTACATAEQDKTRVRALATEMGRSTAQCAIAATSANKQAVIESSADFLRGLVELWAASGVNPDIVWHELHARIEMGELSLVLSRSKNRRQSAHAGPWRVATSKLP